jgi:hypothetical protein
MVWDMHRYNELRGAVFDMLRAGDVILNPAR